MKGEIEEMKNDMKVLDTSIKPWLLDYFRLFHFLNGSSITKTLDEVKRH
jgi:hypothetical protein